jgi:hypothetical protein
VYLSGYVLLPDSVLPLLREAVVIDYDYKDSQRHWRLKESQTLNLEFWSTEKINAMRVAELLEK